MPIPSVVDFENAKVDVDDLADIVNGNNTVTTRLGGDKLSVSQALSQIIVGEVTVYSAATTYTAIEEYVEYSGAIYRPLPSQLPIGPEAFNASKWAIVQGVVTGGILNELSATALIASSDYLSALTNTIVDVLGYSNASDGGRASWRKTGVTGLAASQSPADLGDAYLTDANGHQWEKVGPQLFVEQIGGVLDNATDNSPLRDALVNWSDRTKGTIIVGSGTFICSQLLVSDKYCSIRGISQELSIYKLGDGEDQNCVQLAGAGTGRLYAKDITLDHNSAGQTPGLGLHCIRLAGCDACDLENVTIKNALFYGIGLKDVAAKGCNWRNITIDGCGSDAIDVKDESLGNETIVIDGLTAKNYGLTNTESPGIDIRGEVNANNVKLFVSGENFGIRFRPQGQGPAGWGVITNLNIIGDGLTAQLVGVVYSNDTISNAVVSGVVMRDVYNAVQQRTGCVGGVFENFSCTGVYGGDSNLIQGTDFKMGNGSIQTTAGANRALEIEATAVNAQIENVFIDDFSGAGNPVRIIAGANDTLLSGTLRGGNVSDSGTNTTNNMRII